MLNRVVSLLLACVLLCAAWAIVPSGDAPAAEQTMQTTALAASSTQAVPQRTEPTTRAAAKSAKPAAAPPTQAQAAAHLQQILYNEADFDTAPAQEQLVAVSDGAVYVSNELLIFFKPFAGEKARLRVVESVGGTVVGKMSFLNRYTVQVQSASLEELAALCEGLRQEDSVLFASVNISIPKQAAAVVPDDPWLYGSTSDVDGWDESNPSGSNWWLEAVEALSAWDYADRLSHIKIGIVDSGFDTQHEDLQGKIEFPGKLYERRNTPGNHGTHVAGIIGANANNQVGITGLCWNSTLLCADWQEESWENFGSDYRIYTGFIRAVLGGAKVINFSAGASGNYDDTKPVESFFWGLGMELEAFLYSYTMAKLLAWGYDFVVVQSAGNGDKHNQSTNAYYNGMFCSVQNSNVLSGLCTGVTKADILERIIIVGAAQNMGNATYQQAWFSNAGDNVDICAPGYGVFSSYHQNGAYVYGYMSGTSMAAPVVTGIVAMTWAANSKLSGSEVKRIVCDEANTVCEVADNTTESHPLEYTYRMVNARLSVEAALALHE